MATMRITSCRFVVPIDLYNRDLYVSFGETDDRLRQGLLRYKDAQWVDKAIKNMDLPLLPGHGRMGTNGGFFVLRLGVYPTNALDYATIQHEIFHFVEHMFSMAGMPHSIKYSSEAYAYLTGYLTKEIYHRLWSV